MPGLLVYRFDAPPFFVNAAYLRERVLALADTSEFPTVRAAVAAFESARGGKAP